MSYSFNARGATAALALAAVASEFAKVVEGQPIHKHDEAAVNRAAADAVALLPEDADRDVIVGCNGYLSWENSEGEPKFTGVSFTVNARLIVRE